MSVVKAKLEIGGQISIKSHSESGVVLVSNILVNFQLIWPQFLVSLVRTIKAPAELMFVYNDEQHTGKSQNFIAYES